MEAISPIWLIGIGIRLIGLESIIMSFFVIWFGFGLILVGLSSYIIVYPNIYIQFISVLLVSSLLLFLLKNKFVKKFIKEPEEDKNFLDEEGEGIIKEGKLYYKGSFFNIKSTDDSSYKENETVNVLKIKLNDAYVKKI